MLSLLAFFVQCESVTIVNNDEMIIILKMEPGMEQIDYFSDHQDEETNTK